MTLHEKRRWHKLRRQLTRERDTNMLLDIMLALDRIVVEVSMRMYDVPRRDRLDMRKHNQRLHKAVRKSFEPSRHRS